MGKSISYFPLDEIRGLFSGNCRGRCGGLIVELNMHRSLGTRTKVLREIRRRASQSVSHWIAVALDPRRAQAVAAHSSADPRLHSEQRCQRHGIPRSHENTRYKRYRRVYCEYARPTYGPCGLPDDPCASVVFLGVGALGDAAYPSPCPQAACCGGRSPGWS